MEINNLLRGRDVLIVEDEVLIALDVERIVLACGANACQIVRGAHARNLPIVEGNSNHVIIVDHRSFNEVTTDLALLVESYGSAIVLTTTGEKPKDLAANQRISIVQKPFADADILKALIEQSRHQRPTAGMAST